jgi:predicted HTH transcriptional regulator
MPNPTFLALIAIRREERNLEYEQSTTWGDKVFRVKIAKSILAMSNIRDGGHIIIGMERQADDTYLPKGMEQSHITELISIYDIMCLR